MQGNLNKESLLTSNEIAKNNEIHSPEYNNVNNK